jgi:hypothetical protein
MRLNPFYPSDDPMSSVFYCFGGGGDDGGGGGDSRSEADRSYEDDFGFSSDIAGGFSGSAADVGGRDDNGGDNRPSPSVNPGNIGVGSGAGLGATSNANFSPGPSPGPSTGGSDPFDMDAAAKSYIDQAIANFGVGPTVGVMPDPYLEAAAAGTAVPGPDLPGFGPGFGPGEPGEVAEFNAFPSPGPITQQDYNNLQGGRSVIEQILAERAGAFPGPSPGMTAGGVDTRSFAEKVAAGEIPEDVFVYGASAPSGDEILTFGLDTSDTRSFAEKVAAGEIPEDVFVYGASAPSGDEILTFGLDTSETPPFAEKVAAPQTQQFQELQTTNISLMDQLEDLQQGINMRQSEFDALSARYDELAPLADTVPGLNTQLLDLNTQLNTRANEITGLQTRLDDTFKSYTDLQGQFGTQSDQLTALDEQFGLSQQQIQDQAARIAEQEEAARRNRILGIAGVAPVASSAMTQDNVYNLFGGPGPVSTAPVSMAPAPRPSAQGPVDGGVDDFNTGAYGTRADLGITPNPIESQISIANALKNLDLQAEEEQIFTPINMQLPSFIGAGINLIGGALNAAQKYGGGNIPGYAQDVMNRPGGAPIMANAPMMSPAQPSAFLETLMAASDRQPVGPYSEAEGVPDVLGGFGPNQLSFLPGEPDNIYVGDPRGIEQAQMLDPNVQVLDENYFSQGQELSDRGGDQAAPPALTLPDPVTQECPEGYTRDGSGICVYVGQPRVGVTPYTPMAPVEFSYTGLPSLAPRTLTPTAPNLSFLNRR